MAWTERIDPTELEVFVEQYEPDGTVRWTRRIGTRHTDHPISSVLSNEDGSVLLVSTAYRTWDGEAISDYQVVLLWLDEHGATVRQRMVRVSGGFDPVAYVSRVETGILLTINHTAIRTVFDGHTEEAEGLDCRDRACTSLWRLSDAGGFVSARTYQGMGHVRAAAGPEDSIYLVAESSGPVDFGSGPIGTGTGARVARLDASFVPLWTRDLAPVRVVDALTTSASGRLHLGLQFPSGVSRLDFGSGRTFEAASGTELVLTLSETNHPAWVRAAGSNPMASSPMRGRMTTNDEDWVFHVFTSQLAGFGDDMYAVQVSAYAPTGEMWTRRWNGADADYGHDVDARDGLVVVSGAVEGEVDLGAGPPLATHDFFFLHLVP